MNVFHGEEGQSAMLPVFDDVDHIGMVDGHGDLGLLMEHLNECLIVGEMGEDPFDDDRLIVGRSEVDAKKHLCHSAGSNALQQAIMADDRWHLRAQEHSRKMCGILLSHRRCDGPSWTLRH